MAINEEKIKKILSTQSRKAKAHFAFRCAFRVLPVLANKQTGKELFSYWQEESQAKYLCAIFRALNFPVAAYADNAAQAAQAANAAALSAFPNAYYANVAANAAAFAAFSDGVNAATQAANAYSAYYAFSADSIIFQNVRIRFDYAVNLDLQYLESKQNNSGLLQRPLWNDGQPEELVALEKDFLLGLQELKLDYWAEEYQAWMRGEFDLTRLQRCIEMPEEIIQAGAQAQISYLQAGEQGKLTQIAEARVILLGSGGVGKTSFINRLFGKEVQPKEEPTAGVEVREKDEVVAGEKLHVHYWDFGGQVFLHATHSLFLREQCVYVVMLEARKTDAVEPVEYWLEHVRLYGKGSPTIIVQNKVDELDQGLQLEMPFNRLEIQKNTLLYKLVLIFRVQQMQVIQSYAQH